MQAELTSQMGRMMAARAFFARGGGLEEIVLTIIALEGESLYAKLSLNERILSAAARRRMDRKSLFLSRNDQSYP
jgi:hypothetical protein